MEFLILLIQEHAGAILSWDVCRERIKLGDKESSREYRTARLSSGRRVYSIR